MVRKNIRILFHRPIACHGRIWPVEKQYVLMIFALCFCQLLSTITATVQHAGLENLRRKHNLGTQTLNRKRIPSPCHRPYNLPQKHLRLTLVLCPQKHPKASMVRPCLSTRPCPPHLRAKGKTSRSRLINSSHCADSREFI